MKLAQRLRGTEKIIGKLILSISVPLCLRGKRFSLSHNLQQQLLRLLITRRRLERA